MAEDDRMVTQFRQSMEGQLLKFTNVVKGYQPRWVVLDAERNVIEYYEKEEFRRGGQKARGTLHLFGAAVNPSEEDSQTFTIQSAGPGNEFFRLRASDAKERQRWIMHVRAVSEHAQPVSFVPLVAESVEPARAIASVVAAAETAEEVPVNVLELSDGDVHRQLVGLIDRMRQECELTSAHICALPAPGAILTPESPEDDAQDTARSLDCLDRDLLMMKATIRAAVASVQECHSLLEARKAPVPRLRASRPPQLFTHGALGRLPASRSQVQVSKPRSISALTVDEAMEAINVEMRSAANSLNLSDADRRNNAQRADSFASAMSDVSSNNGVAAPCDSSEPLTMENAFADVIADYFSSERPSTD